MIYENVRTKNAKVIINEIELTVLLNDKGELIRIPPETNLKMKANSITKEMLLQKLKEK